MSRVLYIYLVFIGVVSALFSGMAQAQQFITLEQQFEQGRLTAGEVAEEYLKLADDNVFQKCGTPAVKFFERHQNDIDNALLKKTILADNAIKQKAGAFSFISPDGKFEIFYDTSGQHAVPADDINGNNIPDFVEWTAEAMDSSYRAMVLNLGFRDPIPSGKQYEVYLEDIGSVYGLTRSNPGSPGGTYIQLHHTFLNFPPNTDPAGNQRGALKAAAAHEFKHAIQFAQNEWKGEPDRWTEMDATLMEEIVFDEVNDYYNYLRQLNSVFSSPEKTLIPGNYYQVSWAIYFYEKYGPQFWVRIWQRIEANPEGITFLEAIAAELEDSGHNYKTSVAENYLWHLAAGGVLSPPEYGFRERSEYPAPYIRETLTELSDSLSGEVSLNRYSAHFYEMNLTSQVQGQVLADFEYSNPELQLGILAWFKNGKTEHRMLAANNSGITNFFSPWNWQDLDRLVFTVVNTNTTLSLKYRYSLYTEVVEKDYLSQNYPNPFNPATTITFGLETRKHVLIEVFDYLGRKVQTLTDEIHEAGVHHKTFDAAGLASGMYFYRLTAGNKTHLKKMLLVK